MDCGGGRWLCTSEEVVAKVVEGGRVATAIGVCDKRRRWLAIISMGIAMGSIAQMVCGVCWSTYLLCKASKIREARRKSAGSPQEVRRNFFLTRLVV